MPLRPYGFALACVAASTAVSFAMYPLFALTNLVMIYLLGTLAVAMRGHRGPAAASSILGVLSFDFFFVPPRFTFRVSDVQYVWTFAVMFLTAMIISHLAVRLREEAQAARQQEERSLWLLEKAKKAEVEAETERMRSSLLSSVSHDFRTPLTAIVGSAGALLSRPELQASATARELLQNIQSEGERLSRVVQNLLEATRLESKTVEIHKEACPLEEIIGSALERVEKSLGRRKVTIGVPEALPLIPMDATLIEQVFVNLVENAIRHTPSDTAFEISAEDVGGGVQISVSDHGSGLAAGDFQKVFEKFYHAPASPGAGLGLAICRAIVLAHGGRIWAENRPAGGAVFRFTLPLTSSPADSGGGPMH